MTAKGSREAVLVAGMLLLILCGCQPPAPAPSPSPVATPAAPPPPLPKLPESQLFIKKLRSDMNALKQYHAILKVRGLAASVRTEVWRDGPRLAVVVTGIDSAGNTQGLKGRMVVDGVWHYLELHTGLDIRATKARLDMATFGERPFDTFNDLKGSGLAPGDDVAGTVREFIDTHQLKVTSAREFGGEVCFVLEGDIDWDAMARYRKRIFRADLPRIDNTPGVRLFVSAATSQVRGWMSDLVTGGDLIEVEWRSDPITDQAFRTGEAPDVTQALIWARAVDNIQRPDHVLRILPRLRTTTGEHGCTLLHEAAARDAGQTVPMFRHYIESRDDQGQTPLHVASATGSRQAVRALLRLKADRTATDARGRTPFDVAKDARTAALLR